MILTGQGDRTMFGNEKGLTLVELLVVCVIIAIAFIGLAGLFPVGTQNINQSKLRTIATDLAQEKMEALLDAPSGDGDLSEGTHADPDNPVRSSFNRYWSVTHDVPIAGMMRVEVWVTYPHGTTTREVRLVSHRRN